jgi:hypothetical protein
MNHKKRLDLIENTFNSFNINNLSILSDFYSDNIDFTDPIGNIKGLDKLTKYYAHVYKNVISINFKFHQINHQEDMYFAKWTMNLQVKGLNSNSPYSVEGFSVLKFNADSKVEYHRDYLDLGTMVYEHIPILGKVIKLIKSNLG